MFYLQHMPTGYFADKDASGHHDAKLAFELKDAKAFKTFGEASDFSQNFGSDWKIYS